MCPTPTSWVPQAFCHPALRETRAHPRGLVAAGCGCWLQPGWASKELAGDAQRSFPSPCRVLNPACHPCRDLGGQLRGVQMLPSKGLLPTCRERHYTENRDIRYHTNTSSTTLNRPHRRNLTRPCAPRIELGLLRQCGFELAMHVTACQSERTNVNCCPSIKLSHPFPRPNPPKAGAPFSRDPRIETFRMARRHCD